MEPVMKKSSPQCLKKTLTLRQLLGHAIRSSITFDTSATGLSLKGPSFYFLLEPFVSIFFAPSVSSYSVAVWSNLEISLGNKRRWGHLLEMVPCRASSEWNITGTSESHCQKAWPSLSFYRRYNIARWGKILEHNSWWFQPMFRISYPTIQMQLDITKVRELLN